MLIEPTQTIISNFPNEPLKTLNPEHSNLGESFGNKLHIVAKKPNNSSEIIVPKNPEYLVDARGHKPSALDSNFIIQSIDIDSLEPGLSNKILEALNIKLNECDAQILSYDVLKLKRKGNPPGVVVPMRAPNLLELNKKLSPGEKTLEFAGVDIQKVESDARSQGMSVKEYLKVEAVDAVSGKLILALSPETKPQDKYLLREYVKLKVSESYWVSHLTAGLFFNIKNNPDQITSNVMTSFQQTANAFNITGNAYLNLKQQLIDSSRANAPKLNNIKAVLKENQINPENFIKNFRIALQNKMEADIRHIQIRQPANASETEALKNSRHSADAHQNEPPALNETFVVQSTSLDSLEPGLSKKVQQLLGIELNKCDAQILSFDKADFSGDKTQPALGLVVQTRREIGNPIPKLRFAMINIPQIEFTAKAYGIDTEEHIKAVAVNEAAGKLTSDLFSELNRQEDERLSEYISLQVSESSWLTTLVLGRFKKPETRDNHEYAKVAVTVLDSLRQTASAFGITGNAYLKLEQQLTGQIESLQPAINQGTWLKDQGTLLDRINTVLKENKIDPGSFIKSFKKNLLTQMEVDTRQIRAIIKQ